MRSFFFWGPLAVRAATVSKGFYDRSLHLTYVVPGGRVIPNTDEEILAAIDKIPGGLTMTCPVILNEHPAPHDAFLQQLISRGIKLCLSVGKGGFDGWGFDSEKMLSFPPLFRNYTDCIRVEAWDHTAKYFGFEEGFEYLRWLKEDLGFKHIIMNPWGRCMQADIDAGHCTEEWRGRPWPLEEWGESNYVSTIIYCNREEPYELYEDEDNWKCKPNQLAAFYEEYGPDFIQIVMYESPEHHNTLDWMEEEEKGSSLEALDIAAQQSKEDAWFWQPPWSRLYDPLTLGTWDWIANKIAEVSPPYDEEPTEPPVEEPTTTEKATTEKATTEEVTTEKGTTTEGDEPPVGYCSVVNPRSHS